MKLLESEEERKKAIGMTTESTNKRWESNKREKGK
jgi:hypothetical protein